MTTGSYDKRNRLRQIASMPTATATVSSDYPDGHATRLNQNSTFTATTPFLTYRYVYDGWNLLAILDSNSQLLTSFTWGLDLSGSEQGAGGVGGLLAVYDSSTINNQPSTHFVAYDGNGNVAALVNADDGTISANYEYGPFGEVIRVTGLVAKANPIRFSTKFQDDESDLVYYGYRSYNPALGRWLSRDPIGELGFETLRRGRASLRGDGPNLYLFVRNAPVSFIDAFGLTRVESGTWFPGSISDGVVYWTDVDDGQSGTVTLHRITMAEVEAAMKDLVKQLNGYKKQDGCKSRKYEKGFDSTYFAGENKQHQYYLVDGQGPIYADNQINYIGIGLYEAWLCDSIEKAAAIVSAWKLIKWHDVPSEGTLVWLTVGYDKYKELKSADDSCCRCSWDDLYLLRAALASRR
jgi:RHS repeat-associated protein